MFYKPLHFKQYLQITNKLQNLYYDLNNTVFKQSIRPYSEIKESCPELDDEFKNYNLEVTQSWLFQTDPASEWQDNGTIHIDLDKKIKPNLVLNWPIFNCENTYMNFWQPNVDDSGTPAFTERLQADYTKFEKTNCKLIDRLELLQPHIIDVSIAHSISTNVEKYRLIMSFRFKDNPLHLWF